MKKPRRMNPVDRWAVFGLLLFLAASISHAGLYVSSGGDDSTHDSWSTAYPGLQAARDASHQAQCYGGFCKSLFRSGYRDMYTCPNGKGGLQ